jgi:LysM repeat protein
VRSSLLLSTRALGIALLTALLLSAGRWQTARADQPVHIVQPGENLFRIGLKYGVNWINIMRANGLTSTYLYPGQPLIVPTDAAPSSTTITNSVSTPSATAPAPLPEPNASGSTTYVVQRGDTLFRIATRYGLTTQQLAAANGIYNPSLIYTGQTLTIPGIVSATSAVSGDSTSNPTPAPAPTTFGSKRIYIDISEQHLYAYEGETLVFSFVASTGEPGRDTRPGSYSILTKIPNAYGSTWNIWMPNWLGIYWVGNLQNGIHALPILSNGWRLWDGYLGTPVSYGCVILGVDESQMLYDWAEVGTPVEIQW